MRVSIIIPVWNGQPHLPACLASLIPQAGPDVEVIAVDNASQDGSADLIAALAPQVRLLRSAYNRGFSGGCNLGIAAAKGDVLILLNQDVRVRPGWLDAILTTFEGDPAAGVVGCKMLYPDERTLQHAGAHISPDDALTLHYGRGELDSGQYDRLVETDYVTGAALAVQRRVLDHIGGLDEGFGPALYEEIDLCYRARRLGFHVLYQPAAVLIHHETVSAAQPGYAWLSLFHRNRYRFVLRHWAAEHLHAFFQRERASIMTASEPMELLGRSRGALDDFTAWPELAAARAVDPSLAGALSAQQQIVIAEDLILLRQAAAERLVVALTQAAGEAGLGATPASDLKALALLAEDPTPRSPLPLIGPLITRFRALWLATMVRPYVLPILIQQTRYNQRLAQTVEALLYQAQMLSEDEVVLMRLVRQDRIPNKPAP